MARQYRKETNSFFPIAGRCTGNPGLQVGDTIVQAMHDVLQGPRGTARAVGFGAPYTMAGKSGTAQVFSVAQEEEYDEEEIEERLRDHALFISFAPVENPQIAVAVIIENGSSGSRVAAPIAKASMDQYLGYTDAAD